MIFQTDRPASDFLKVSLISISSLLLFIIISRINRSSTLFLPSYLIAALGFIFLFLFLERTNFSFASIDRNYFWIITIGIRIVILLFPIALSDDIFRYIWDAEIQSNGINPYIYAPDAAELVPYRSSWWHLINQRDLPTPYPPFSEFLFFILLSNNLDIDTRILLFRVVMTVFDIGIIFVLEKILRILEKPGRYILYYAWSPLVLIEFAGNGHNDVVAVFFMLLALYYHLLSKERSTKHKIMSAFFLSLAVLTKIFPIIMLAFFLPWWRLREGLAFITPIILLSLPYVRQGIIPIFSPGQQIFVRYFEFNAGIFRLFQLISKNFEDPVLVARFIYLGIMILVAIPILGKYYLRVYQQTYTDNRMIDAMVILYFITLLLAPDIQPWYVLWVFPLGIISKYIPNMIHSITVIFSYEIYINYDRYGIWEEKLFILILEYSPIFLFYLYPILKRSGKIHLT